MKPKVAGIVIYAFSTISDGLQPTSFLFLVVMPGATSSFLILVAMPLLLLASLFLVGLQPIILYIGIYWLPGLTQATLPITTTAALRAPRHVTLSDLILFGAWWSAESARWWPGGGAHEAVLSELGCARCLVGGLVRTTWSSQPLDETWTRQKKSPTRQ